MIANTLPQSLIDNPLLSQWVGFEADGRVRVGTGKVEIGQGILTALTQIAAEELDVDPTRVRLASGDTKESPFEGFTSGSQSVAVSGASIRLVCAEVRALCLQRMAEKLGCPAGDLSIENGLFLRAGRETGHDYWSMAADIDLSRKVTGTAPTKLPSQYRVVGRHLPRLDLPAKVMGAAFIHDIAPERVLHARVLRRPWRGARFKFLDEDAVHAAAGAPIDILREGDLVALVGNDEVAVMRAAEAAVRLATWDGGLPVPSEVDQPDWLKAQPSRNRVVEAGLPGTADTGRVVERHYSRSWVTYGSIGLSCALARFKNGELEVWSHSQGVFALREGLARTLRLDVSRITVHHRQGAGCYGHNSADDVAFDAAFVAMRAPNQMVRVQWSREDEFSSAPLSPAMAIRLRAMLADDGRPVDWAVEIWSPVHAQRPGTNGNSNLLGAEALPHAPARNEVDDVSDKRGGGAARNAYAIYDLPRHRLIHHMLTEVPLRTSSLRGLGAWANVFAIESFIDELADVAGEDPIAYRLALLSDPRARCVIETAAQMSGWFARREQGEGRAQGLGFARYKNTAAYAAVVAEVEVENEVRLKRVWCCVDAGLVIAPDGAANQVEGGIIQAASFALKERIRFEDGRVAAKTWDDYPILRFSDVPEIDVAFIEAQNEPALGLGEASLGPTAAAIGNAVARALGKRVRDLPLTRDRIMAALLADD